MRNTKGEGLMRKLSREEGVNKIPRERGVNERNTKGGRS